MIDLRSDSVTLPPPTMLEAMARSPLGDDVYGEDPTVNRLEERSAGRLGMEAALFTASGTMANLLALLSHAPRGAKVLMGDRSDLWLWEAGGASVLGSLVCHPIPTQPTGELALADLDAAIEHQDDPQCAVVGLICIENTHGMCGGRVLALDYLDRLRGFADRRGLPVHLDGSRVFHAAIALGIEARQIAERADSLSFCLSKGLAAPVGAILAGRRDFIGRARRWRKMIGGGMRQAGVLAGAGLFALENMVDRLAEDHAHARRLAAGLAALPEVVVEGTPETNILFWRLADPHLPIAPLLSALEDSGVRALELEKGWVRMVTHYGITGEDIDRTIEAVRRALIACALPSLRAARAEPMSAIRG